MLILDMKRSTRTTRPHTTSLEALAPSATYPATSRPSEAWNHDSNAMVNNNTRLPSLKSQRSGMRKPSKEFSSLDGFALVEISPNPSTTHGFDNMAIISPSIDSQPLIVSSDNILAMKTKEESQSIHQNRPKGPAMSLPREIQFNLQSPSKYRYLLRYPIKPYPIVHPKNDLKDQKMVFSCPNELVVSVYDLNEIRPTYEANKQIKAKDVISIILQTISHHDEGLLVIAEDIAMTKEAIDNSILATDPREGDQDDGIGSESVQNSDTNAMEDESMSIHVNESIELEPKSIESRVMTSYRHGLDYLVMPFKQAANLAHIFREKENYKPLKDFLLSLCDRTPSIEGSTWKDEGMEALGQIFNEAIDVGYADAFPPIRLKIKSPQILKGSISSRR